MEKFADNETETSPFQPETGHFVSSQEDSPTPESPTTGEVSKIKRRVEEQNSTAFNTLEERQEKFLEFSNRNTMQRERLNDILERKMEYRELKNMMIDLNTITDPNKRDFMNQQQLKIAAKRAEQQDKGSQNASRSFGDFFENLQGPGNGLPDY
ncbi:hypothetical protein Ddye_014560 [Dipteronia dyeriana]|uniref:Uncharacterized protein n=1 Tax=Dipteronia dyeriana TaxID=168575 RepID=A0AAD9X8E4_9ROSI|nr:hypothetical protein Ddye_014560 [Dipteronia dyeriana]